MRPYLLFVSGAAGLVGLVYWETSDLLLSIIAFIPLFLSYGFGQALTDCFQTDTDALSAPYRPLVRGLIMRKQVLVVSLVGLIAGILIMTLLNPWNALLAGLAVIGLLTYTFFKRTWWGGPPWNSWIVALLPIMGRLVGSPSFRSIFYYGGRCNWDFILAVAAVYFGYANFVVMGYLKDISADRTTGYRTFPVVFGWRAAAVYSDITALLAAASTAVVLVYKTANLAALAIFAVGLIINLYAQVRIHCTRDEKQTHQAIANVVRTFILYCGAIVVCLRFTWLVVIVPFYLLFELTLRMRPERTQI